MKNLVAVFLCSCFVLNSVDSTEAQVWRRIVPLKSNRADVERLLGPREAGYGIIYELLNGNLFIEYSSGPCRDTLQEGWNIPEDFVISLSFSPKVKRFVGSYKLERKGFKKITDSHIGWGYYLVNDRKGIMYDVQEGRVENVEYYPSKMYDHLRCNNNTETSQGKSHKTY